MRTEVELRAMLAQLVAEYERATAAMASDPIRVTELGDATYQITLRQTAANLAQGINILRWVLGELNIREEPRQPC